MAGERLRNPFAFGLTVTVRAPVNPSEDAAKVLGAVDLLFGSASRTSVSSSAGFVVAEYEGDQALARVYEQARSRMTISVLRRLLKKRQEEGSTSFLLNKQVAAGGVVVFCENEAESPLGPITVRAETPEVEHFIDWLAPDVRRPRHSFRKH
jgi:predicted RNA binding protein with dsRBD fold (UPF0201 family)